MDLPPDKIQALRRVVDEHLREGGVYDEIRGLLSEYKAQEGDILHSDGLLGVIEEKGIIQRILDSISGQQLKHKKSSVATGASFLSLTGFSRADGKRQSERRHLRVQLVGGRAFLEHLDIDPSIRSAANEKLFACVQFGGQRFKSRGVDCVCDPPFDDEFFVDLDKEIDEGRRRKQAAGAGGTITKGLWQQRYAMPTPRNFTGGSSSKDRALLDVSTQLHIVLIRVDETLQKRRYVGENVVEWRNVLKTGAVNLSVEIGGSGQGLKVPIGVLELKLELMPSAAPAFIPEDEIRGQLSRERNNEAATDREFLVYASRWWAEYHAVDPSFSCRNIKVFANLATHSAAMVPTPAFISPITADRVLESPMEAARFVALLTHDKDDDRDVSANGVSSLSASLQHGAEAWPSLFAFLSKGKGEQPEHANLLCCLLLGHGLDAWVALGVDSKGNNASAVLTRMPKQGSGSGENMYDVRYWDVLTGATFDCNYGSPSVGLQSWHGIHHVHCVYSFESFAGNIQPDACVTTTSHDFADSSLWMSMNPIKLTLIAKLTPPCILPPTFSKGEMSGFEVDLEHALKISIGHHREQLGLVTIWDDGNLNHVMSQALWNYEYQKLTATQLESRTFQTAVRSVLHTGQNCTAFPVNFSHTSPLRIVNYFLTNKHTKDIVALYGDELTHTLRVRIVPYAEDCVSVWVMLAAVYTS